ncbi:L-asparaginase [Grosmannia clavigera kw1407]|uniref:asparaginase n=1 Tax=Grosmannia clavigera (strain kw1407 / UAMH 11150) TaxID=655863 RepID=F0XE72_GROCL|nr:L-asparaginase [Grosmannia clavigera kw1407]EFX03481.1 L-asparaginase [Grosmannia clavigera kw1407]
MPSLRKLVIAAASAIGAQGSPISLPRGLLSARDTSNSSLPNITIFATGGTIAGSASSSSEVTGYKAGALGVDILIDAVPEIRNASNVSGVQYSNIGSQMMNTTLLVGLSQQIQAALDEPTVAGVVVTHGTDTMEETAFFLDLTLRTEKPVVVVGAMRPATAISADGPMNLLAAVTLAASAKGRGRGVMIVLNDRIASAYYTTKTNANALDTFKAYEQGFLGVFEDISPVFYYPPVLPAGRPYFDIMANDPADGMPQVDILYGYQQLNAALIPAAVATGAKGLVFAGSGAGSWTDDGNAAAEKAIKENGTAIVYSRRPMDGYVAKGNLDGGVEYGFGGGFLSPPKARIMLQLALNAGYSTEQMRTVFEFSN